VWSKWEGDREAIAKAAACCWILAEDLPINARVRLHGTFTSGQGVIQTAKSGNDLDLVELLNKIVKRQCLQYVVPVLELNPLVAKTELKIDHGTFIDPEMLVRYALSLLE